MSDSGLTVREQQAHDRREQIVEVALSLFAQHGYAGTSTRKVAQTAGVTEGLIFHYFPTKAHLLAATLETRHSFLSELRELLTAATGRPVDAVLPEIASGWLTTLWREADVTTVMLATAQSDPMVNDVLQASIREGVDRLATYLASRVAVGELRADLAVEHVALAFYSTLLVFFLSHRHLPEAVWQMRAAAYTQEVVRLWLEGAR